MTIMLEIVGVIIVNIRNYFESYFIWYNSAVHIVTQIFAAVGLVHCFFFSLI